MYAPHIYNMFERPFALPKIKFSQLNASTAQRKHVTETSYMQTLRPAVATTMEKFNVHVHGTRDDSVS